MIEGCFFNIDYRNLSTYSKIEVVAMNYREWKFGLACLRELRDQRICLNERLVQLVYLISCQCLYSC